MKDIQKIKEFFSKPLNEGNKEYFKPSIRKDKSNPNFLFVDIPYPEGSDVLSVGGSKTMGGQDREEGAAKAMSMGNNIAKKLQAKYNIEDIEVKDLKNGKVEVFAVSDDFTKMASPSLNEDEEEETAIDMAKKQLDQLGVKYEMSSNKFKPFKAIYKPMGKSDDWYDKFDEIVYLFNLGSAVKSSISEAKEQSLYKDWDQFEKPSKILVYLNNGKTLEITPLKLKGGKRVYDAILQAFIDDRLDITNKVIQGMTNNLSETKSKDKVDTITMDVPLFLRMLEYSREDASQDMDLHDVTEKAISLGKERGILQMDDYDEIIGTAEEIEEGVYGKGDKRRGLQNASKLSSAEYQMAKKLKSFKASDWKWNADEDLYNKVNEVSDYMKRRKAQDDYAVSKKDKPAKSYNPKPSGKTDYMKRREKELAEAILTKLKK
jgi:hypothetical protein